MFLAMPETAWKQRLTRFKVVFPGRTKPLENAEKRDHSETPKRRNGRHFLRPSLQLAIIKEKGVKPCFSLAVQCGAIRSG